MRAQSWLRAIARGDDCGADEGERVTCKGMVAVGRNGVADGVVALGLYRD
jgi:hypothetical protein